MKRAIALIILAVAVLFVASCTAGPNALTDKPDEDGDIAGFWQGLWHGIIAPVTFIISLFSDKIGVYEVHNNGAWYNLGFLFGMVIILGGSGGGAASRRRRR